jgi:hypothetical protein
MVLNLKKRYEPFRGIIECYDFLICCISYSDQKSYGSDFGIDLLYIVNDIKTDFTKNQQSKITVFQNRYWHDFIKIVIAVSDKKISYFSLY